MINEEKELILDKNNKDITANVIERTSSKIMVKKVILINNQA